MATPGEPVELAFDAVLVNSAGTAPPPVTNRFLNLGFVIGGGQRDVQPITVLLHPATRAGIHP